MSGHDSLARLHRCALQWIRDYDRAVQPPTADEWAKKLTAAVKPAMLALEKPQLKKLKDIWKQMWDFKKSSLAGEHVNDRYIKYILRQVSDESQKMMGKRPGEQGDGEAKAKQAKTEKAAGAEAPQQAKAAPPQQPEQPQQAQQPQQAVPQRAPAAEGPALTLLETEVLNMESETAPLPQPPQNPANGGLIPAPTLFNVGDIVRVVSTIYCKGAVAVDVGGRGTITKAYPGEPRYQVHFQQRQDGGGKPMIVQAEQLQLDNTGPPPGQALLPPPPMMSLQQPMQQPLLHQQPFQPTLQPLQQPMQQPWNLSPPPQMFSQQPAGQPPWAMQSPPPAAPNMPHPGFPPPQFANFPGGPNPMPFSAPAQVFTGGPTGPGFNTGPARLSGERLEKLMAANLGGGTSFSGGINPGPPPTMPSMVPPPAAQAQPNPHKAAPSAEQAAPAAKAAEAAPEPLPKPTDPPAEGEKPAAAPSKKDEEPLTDDEVMDAYHKLLEEI